VDKCDSQCEAGLRALDALAGAASGGWLHGDGITLGDVTAVIAHDFVSLSAPYVLERSPVPALAQLSAKANEMPEFAETKP